VLEPDNPDFLDADALAILATALRRLMMRKVAMQTTRTTTTAAPIIPPSSACVSPLEESDEASTFATAVAEGVNFVTVEEAAAGVASA
jgi:hypothetical protein